jgi:isoleucyl-tRNA synthetase
LVLAPFTPFLAEELFLKLTGGELGESVHLLDWPKVGAVNEAVLSEMAEVRELINIGLSQRAANSLKVRQPLASAKLLSSTELSQELESIVLEELNVKSTSVEARKDRKPLAVELDLNVTPELKREGMMREVIRNVQSARKAAGLQVDDRIHLCLQTDSKELQQAIEEHADTITSETLATGLVDAPQGQFSQTAKVEGQELSVSLSKA